MTAYFLRMKITLLLFSLLFVVPVAAGETTIKFATLAPEGSTWMNVMKEMDAEIRQKTGGEIKFKIYPGGVSGDEKDVVRKMRLGQLHSAGFSGVGLGEILPSVRILDLPFLFESEEEVDYIERKYTNYFYRAFEEKGHILLGWAEIGPVHIFSRNEFHALPEMKGLKMWMWEGDPLAGALLKAFNLAPYPLSITDVLMALQTGMIDTVYVSPLGAISLQWFTKVRYMISLPMAVSAGAVTISRKKFNKLSPKNREILKEVASRFLKKLTRLSREDNQKSIEAMKKNGLKIIDISDPAKINEFRKVGESTRKELTGKLYPPELIEGIMRDLVNFRQGKK